MEARTNIRDTNVLHVPGLGMNMILVSQLQDKGYKLQCILHWKKVYVQYPSWKKKRKIGAWSITLYRLQLESPMALIGNCIMVKMNWMSYGTGEWKTYTMDHWGCSETLLSRSAEWKSQRWREGGNSKLLQGQKINSRENFAMQPRRAKFSWENLSKRVDKGRFSDWSLLVTEVAAKKLQRRAVFRIRKYFPAVVTRVG